ncbi:hypothetical protein F4824DRAFT_359432 [Ustulina deusta]|nr:hypothetical protein F4824DRAFT_359432 [Ustulina deusta]
MLLLLKIVCDSMLRWYGEARVSYVYLANVPSREDPYDEQHSAFYHSRWFTRGWTLQELIVPELLKFFDKTWTVLFEILKHHQCCRGSVHLVYPCLSRSSASLGLNRGIPRYSISNIDTQLKDVPVATKLSRFYTSFIQRRPQSILKTTRRVP